MTLLVFLLSLTVAGLLAGLLSLYEHTTLLQEKLNRLSATDDEIDCVLEASDSPKAKMLLAVLRQPQLKTPVPSAFTLSTAEVVADFDSLMSELGSEHFDSGRVDVLVDYVRAGAYFSAQQVASIMGAFDFDHGRSLARSAIAGRRA